MSPLEKLKNGLIDRILISKNERLLEAIGEILDSTESDEILDLNSHEIEMLWMSERDIEEGNLISEAELDELDSKWMED